MKIKDIIEEIKENDFTDSRRLWLEAIEFKLYNPDGKLAKRIVFDNLNKRFEYEELEASEYNYEVNEEYINFVVIECRVLLKEVLL